MEEVKVTTIKMEVYLHDDAGNVGRGVLKIEVVPGVKMSDVNSMIINQCTGASNGAKKDLQQQSKING